MAKLHIFWVGVANLQSWGRGGRSGSEMAPFESALVSSYSSPHNNFFSIFSSFRDIAAFVLQNAIFSTSPLLSPKFRHVPLGVGGWPLGYEERSLVSGKLFVQLVSKISNLCGPDPLTLRTDGRHAISIPRFALKCTAR